MTLFTGDRAEIVGCIDRNAEQSKYADRYPILKPEDLNHKAFDYVLICSRDYQREIAEVLREKNVPAEKIAVAPNCLRIDTEYQNTEALEQIFGWGAFLPTRRWGPACRFKTVTARTMSGN